MRRTGTDAAGATVAFSPPSELGGGERRQVARGVRRRKPDARFWGPLSPDRARAAEAIALGHEIAVRGLAVRTTAYDRLGDTGAVSGPGGRQDISDWAMARLADYRRWLLRMAQEGLEIPPVLDFLARDEGLSAIDRRRRHRNGWARAAVLAGIDCYCRMRGWGPP